MTTTSPTAEQITEYHPPGRPAPPEVTEVFATEQRDRAAADNPAGAAEPSSWLPDRQLLDVNDQPTMLAQNLGGKPAVIVFYPAICGPNCNIAQVSS